MQQTFSLFPMQRPTIGTTTNDTATHYGATVSATTVHLQKRVEAQKNPKNIWSHAKEVSGKKLGLVVDVFTLLRDSDVPVPLVSQPTVVHVGLQCRTFSLGARGTQWAQCVTRCGHDMQRASGKHVREDRQLK